MKLVQFTALLVAMASLSACQSMNHAFNSKYNTTNSYAVNYRAPNSQPVQVTMTEQKTEEIVIAQVETPDNAVTLRTPDIETHNYAAVRAILFAEDNTFSNGLTIKDIEPASVPAYPAQPVNTAITNPAPQIENPLHQDTEETTYYSAAGTLCRSVKTPQALGFGTSALPHETGINVTLGSIQTPASATAGSATIVCQTPDNIYTVDSLL